MRVILITCLMLSGCNAVAPTKVDIPFRTSRVDPRTEPNLAEYVLEHDPFEEGVSLCRTRLREYCSEGGERCDWTIDLYTVKRPEVCPIEPIY